MNETQIEAGPELDALIAVEVMGWTDQPTVLANGLGRMLDPMWGHTPEPAPRIAHGGGLYTDPAFSTSYEGMGLVLERMQALGWGMHLDRIAVADEWTADFLKHGQPDAPRAYVSAPTLPHAVALAALAAVRA